MEKSTAGSLKFMAPELFVGKTHSTPKLDIWSIGCLLYAMIMGEYPFSDSDREQLKKIILKKRNLFVKISKSEKPSLQWLSWSRWQDANERACGQNLLNRCFASSVDASARPIWWRHLKLRLRQMPHRRTPITKTTLWQRENNQWTHDFRRQHPFRSVLKWSPKRRNKICGPVVW